MSTQGKADNYNGNEKKRTERREIVIRSDVDLQSGQTNSNFSVILRNFLKVQSIKFKAFKSHNSVLPWTGTGTASTGTSGLFWTIGGIGYNAVVAVPSSWTGADIATAIQTALNSTGPGGFTVSFNIAKGTFLIVNGSAFVLNFSSAPANNVLWYVLGFSRLTDTSSATSQTSTTMAHLQGITEWYLTCKQITRQKTFCNFLTSSTQGSTSQINNSQNLFMEIPVTVDIGSPILLTETGYINLEYFFGDYAVLDHLEFIMYDSYGNNITLNSGFTLWLEAVVIISDN